MAKHYLQLTYSVIPDANRGDEAAKVRRALRKDNYRTVDNLETVLIGTAEFDKTKKEDQRKEAQKGVKDFITSILKEEEAESYVTVHCCLMVDGLGEPMIFSI